MVSGSSRNPQQKCKNMKTLQLRNSVNRSPLRRAFLVVPLVLACLALSPAARAVLPPPDGHYADRNTAEGEDALFSLTTGAGNTALGNRTLYNNTTGFANTATGSNALFSNTNGVENTATGLGALFSNTTGVANTANGVGALDSNTTGGVNTAMGDDALFSNTTGEQNTATGFGALYSNTTGFNNTANGLNALSSNITGNRNAAFGRLALFNNTSGSRNIALGNAAGFNLITGDDNIDIGNQGVAAESGTIRIGTQGTQTATYIAGISGVAVTGVPVRVSSNGQLGVAASSKRFKDDITPMDKASEAILALKPVTFRYKKELDPDRIPQFGLVAEDVEKVNPALVARDDQGKIYTVRYDAVNAMLLNEFLKEHRKVQEQEATINQLQAADTKQEATIAKQQKQIETLTTGLQKVSDQLELSKPVPRTVVNNQ
jgi:uncharacterized coiled-coil protein SlyX